MRKIMVLQHVAHELLGTLNPLLKAAGMRVRYVNFERHPHSIPDIGGYNGLIVLGGPMGVYEKDNYPHIEIECQIIEKALSSNLPVLGICFGSQLLAHVLGAKIFKAKTPEIGWCELAQKPSASNDALMRNFLSHEMVFQLHQDGFEIPSGAIHLASSKLFEGQAYRWGANAYGFQFHLEVDKRMIERWLRAPTNQRFLHHYCNNNSIKEIGKTTDKYIARSIGLSHLVFSEFVNLFGFTKTTLLGSGHGKS